jgi:lycopene cyclase domain-containing protein
MSERYYYLLLDLGSVLFPFLWSFERRLRFFTKWRGLFKGIGVMALVFLVWDGVFTQYGVWGFSKRYTIGTTMLGMPVEEWLFFVCITYACLFLYEVMHYALKRDVLGTVARPLSIALMVLLLLVGCQNLHRLYTSITCLSTVALLAIHVFHLRSTYLGRFYLGYVLSLVPFFVVNGILTGWLLPEPIVWYNDAENLGIRMGSIPVEDSVYLLFMLLLTTTFYERGLQRDHGDRAVH